MINLLQRWLRHLEAGLAGLSLMLLLLLTLGQIIARNGFDTGLPAADTLARNLVLYVAFFGAALASDYDRHIKIDVICTCIKEHWIRRLYRPLQALGAVITFYLAKAAWRFWWDEWQFVPSHEHWTVLLLAVIPLGFALLCLHFILGALFGPARDLKKP